MPASQTGQGQGRNVEELKGLVVHTLETNGVLGQIRAELRANVYKAIDCDEDVGASTSVRSAMAQAKMTKSPVGQLMAEIVAEFFEFYYFRHTLSVFLPESNLGKERRSRAEVAVDAGLIRIHSETSLLEQLMSLSSSSSHKMGEGWHSSASSTTASSPPPQLLASMASTRHSAWETPGNDTPPTGQVRPQGGDRTRDSSGGAAVVDALSSVVAGHEVHKGISTPEDKKEEAPKVEEEPHEEVRERRQRTTAPRGKLPALSSATSPLSSGKELLPPLRGVGLGSSLGSRSAVSGIHSPEEEVSLGEQSGGALSEPLDEVDRQLARLNRPTVGRVGLAAAAGPSVRKRPNGPEAATGAGDSASDESGSGDIELTGNRGNVGNSSSGSSLAGGPVRALPSEGSAQDDGLEEVEESIEELYSGEMEAYSEGSGGPERDEF